MSSSYNLVNNITDKNIKSYTSSGPDLLSLKRSSQLCFQELVVAELSALLTCQLLLLGTYMMMIMMMMMMMMMKMMKMVIMMMLTSWHSENLN